MFVCKCQERSSGEGECLEWASPYLPHLPASGYVLQLLCWTISYGPHRLVSSRAPNPAFLLLSPHPSWQMLPGRSYQLSWGSNLQHIEICVSPLGPETPMLSTSTGRPAGTHPKGGCYPYFHLSLLLELCTKEGSLSEFFSPGIHFWTDFAHYEPNWLASGYQASEVPAQAASTSGRTSLSTCII